MGSGPRLLKRWRRRGPEPTTGWKQDGWEEWWAVQRRRAAGQQKHPTKQEAVDPRSGATEAEKKRQGNSRGLEMGWE
eukprot:3769297-Pleurochrysis_carterae.AAC.3